jgi:hypothetical protein
MTNPSNVNVTTMLLEKLEALLTMLDEQNNIWSNSALDTKTPKRILHCRYAVLTLRDALMSPNPQMALATFQYLRSQDKMCHIDNLKLCFRIRQGVTTQRQVEEQRKQALRLWGDFSSLMVSFLTNLENGQRNVNTAVAKVELD